LYDFIRQYVPDRVVRHEHQQSPEHHEVITMPVPPPCTISQEDFRQMKESISKQSFDNTKATMARQIIKSANCPTTQQVKEILGLFSFEETKLDIAKFAYDYTIDKRNYFAVNDVFSFAASVEELTKYINSKR
jgi:hypothetical protein